LRGNTPPVRLSAQVDLPHADPLPDRYSIRVRFDPQNTPTRGTACRAFLIEQGVLDRLRARAAPAVVCREGTRLTIRDLCTGQVRAEVGAGRRVRAAAVLSEDQVVLQTLEGGIEVWDTLSGDLTTWVEPRMEAGHCGLAVSSTGEVAWGNAAGQVTALDPRTCTRRVVQQHPAPVVALATLPDGRLASGHTDGTVCVAGETCADPERDPISGLTSCGENGIAFKTPLGRVYRWAPGTDRLAALPGLASWLASLPDGRLALAGVEGLTVWDADSPGRHLLTDAPTQSILAAPGPRLVKLASDGSLWSWNLRTGSDRLLLGRESGQAFADPLACGRLRPALPEEDEAALSWLFDHRVVSEEFPAQQALSALPELEGQWHGEEITLDAGIPADSPNISSRAWVVVVLSPSEERDEG
jgi:hypothetical protein